MCGGARTTPGAACLFDAVTAWPFSAQVWPEQASGELPPWHGPQLLTDKVVSVLRLIDSDRVRCSNSTVASGSDAVDSLPEQPQPWACIVFVETKVSVACVCTGACRADGCAAVVRCCTRCNDTRATIAATATAVCCSFLPLCCHSCSTASRQRGRGCQAPICLVILEGPMIF